MRDFVDTQFIEGKIGFSYSGLLGRTQPWVYTTEEIEDALENKIELPKLETSFYLYEPGWAKNLKFPVIVKRSWVKELPDLEKPEAPEKYYWKYYAVMTNRGLYPLTAQNNLEFHALRGNAENFIKEDKYGYDLKHYPCQKLKANHAYGLLAKVAANFLRCLTLLQDPVRPNFAKKIRSKLITIPGKLIFHSNKKIMKIPKTYYQERESMMKAWRATLLPPSFSTA